MKKSIILLKIVTLSIALSSQFIFNRQKLWAMPQLKPATLIELNEKGKLRYRPNRNTDYRPASLYMKLKLNYHLWLKSGGNAAIECPNGSNIIDIPQEKELTVANLGCPKIPANEDNSLRGGENSNLPFIISPRKTLIITNKPIIRWNSLPNVEEYQITLYSDSEDKEIWSIASSSANTRLHSPSANFPLTFREMDYPQDQLPLEVGKKYRVIVTAKKEKNTVTEECPDGWKKRGLFECYVSSDFEELPPFNQLDSSTVEEIETRKIELQQQYDGVTEALTLASLFKDNNLNMDAIEILENLVSQGNQTSAVYGRLGDLYQKIQLNSLAEIRYQKAIELAKEQQNLEQQALAQWELAQILQSIELATEAKKAYEEIGDSEEVEKIQEKIDKWR